MFITRYGCFAIIASLINLSACGGGSDSTPPPALKSIKLMSIETSYIEGTQDEVYVSGSYDNGTNATLTDISWSSSNPSVATVNSTNMLIALNPGVTKIAVSYNGLAASADVVITKAMLTNLEVLADKKSLPAGLNLQLTARGTFNNGKTENLPEVSWTSSDEAVAIIDQTGKVSAINSGSVQLNANTGNFTSSFGLTVSPAELTAINLLVPHNSVPVGLTLQATATGIYTDKSNHSLTPEWISSNASVMSVDTQGIISGKAVGQASITANFNGISSEKITLSVTDAIPSGLELSPNTHQIPLGLSAKSQATLLLSDGSTMVPAEVVWSSDDVNIADVSVQASGATISAKSKGSTLIHASADGYKAVVNVTVTDAVTQGITIDTDALSIPTGLTAKIQLSAKLSDGSEKSVSDKAAWSVSNNDLGGLSAPSLEGVIFTAGTQGEGLVSASYLGFSDNVTITVTEAVPIGLIDVPVETLKIPLGLTESITFNLEYSDGSKRDPASGVIWKVSDQSIGSVSSNGNGSASISGTKQGSFVVIAKYGEWSFELPVEITQAEPVSLFVPEALLYADDPSLQLVAEMTYTDGTTKDVSGSVIWSSANPEIATISNAEGTKGQVTAVAKGQAQITASFNGGKISYTQTVSIKEPRLITGFISHNHRNGSAVIGEGENSITLAFSNSGGSCVYFYSDYNGGVGISNGAISIADISDASRFSMASRVTTPCVNSDQSVVVAKNHGGYYAAIQVHAVRDDIDTVVFSWAIRTDGGTDFSKFVAKNEIKLLQCQEADFWGNDAGCTEVGLPYSATFSKTINQTPLPYEFLLDSYLLVNLGQPIKITSVQAIDTNNVVSPYFNGVTNQQQELPSGHSGRLDLMSPPTGGLTARPSFSFNIDNNAAKSFSYSGSFTSN